MSGEDVAFVGGEVKSVFSGRQNCFLVFFVWFGSGICCKMFI